VQVKILALFRKNNFLGYFKFLSQQQQAIASVIFSQHPICLVFAKAGTLKNSNANAISSDFFMMNYSFICSCIIELETKNQRFQLCYQSELATTFCNFQADQSRYEIAREKHNTCL